MRRGDSPAKMKDPGVKNIFQLPKSILRLTLVFIKKNAATKQPKNCKEMVEFADNNLFSFVSMRILALTSQHHCA